MTTLSRAGMNAAQRLYGNTQLTSRLSDGVSRQDLTAAENVLRAATSANARQNTPGTRELLQLASRLHTEVSNALSTQNEAETSRETSKDAATEGGWTPAYKAALKTTVQNNMRGIATSGASQGQRTRSSDPSLAREVGRAIGGVATVLGAAKLEEKTGVPVLNRDRYSDGFGVYRRSPRYDVGAELEDRMLREQARQYDRSRRAYDQAIDRRFEEIVRRGGVYR